LVHPFPNVIKVISKTKNIKPGDTVLGDLNIDSIDVEKDGITNSFGVPSKLLRFGNRTLKKRSKA